MNRKIIQREINYPVAVGLDLDETLVHTFTLEEEPDGLFDVPKPNHYQINYGYDIANGVFRPHLEEALDKIFKNAYPVFVWTAGEPDYAKDICKHVFKKHQPAKIYSRADCELISENSRFKKPLRKVFADFPHLISSERLVFIDDSQSAFFSKDLCNVIPINRWHGTGKDNSLLQIANIIESLKKVPGDLRTHLKFSYDWGDFWETQSKE